MVTITKTEDKKLNKNTERPLELSWKGLRRKEKDRFGIGLVVTLLLLKGNVQVFNTLCIKLTNTCLWGVWELHHYSITR